MTDRWRRKLAAPNVSDPIFTTSATERPAQQHIVGLLRSKGKCMGVIYNRWFAVVVIVLAHLLPLPALAQIDETKFQSDVRYLSSLPSRSPGTDGYFQAAGFVQRELAALPNVEWRRHEFPVTVPITESASLTLADGAAQKIYPFWPAGVRLCATPAEGISGKLVYCRRGDLKDISPAVLKGQIAVLEAAGGSGGSGANWTLAVNLVLARF